MRPRRTPGFYPNAGATGGPAALSEASLESSSTFGLTLGAFALALAALSLLPLGLLLLAELGSFSFSRSSSVVGCFLRRKRASSSSDRVLLAG